MRFEHARSAAVDGLPNDLGRDGRRDEIDRELADHRRPVKVRSLKGGAYQLAKPALAVESNVRDRHVVEDSRKEEQTLARGLVAIVELIDEPSEFGDRPAEECVLFSEVVGHIFGIVCVIVLAMLSHHRDSTAMNGFPLFSSATEMSRSGSA